MHLKCEDCCPFATRFHQLAHFHSDAAVPLNKKAGAAQGQQHPRLLCLNSNTAAYTIPWRWGCNSWRGHPMVRSWASTASPQCARWHIPTIGFCQQKRLLPKLLKISQQAMAPKICCSWFQCVSSPVLAPSLLAVVLILCSPGRGAGFDQNETCLQAQTLPRLETKPLGAQ